MKKIFLFLFLGVYLFGCAMCQLNIPKVHVDVNGETAENRLILNVRWEFSQAFTDDTFILYDQNKNNTLDKDELLFVEKNLVEYIEKDSYLTFVRVFNKDEKKGSKHPSLKVTPLQKEMKYINRRFVFDYKVSIDAPGLNDTATINIRFFDQFLYFDFIIRSFSLNGKAMALDEKSLSDGVRIESMKEYIAVKKDLKQKEQGAYIAFLSKQLEDLKTDIKKLLTDLKEKGSVMSYFWLFLFSLLYGMVHAIGPGHGKSLVSAYFLSSDRSYLKAFNISALIGVVHTFSAFILTFTVYYILNEYLSRYFTDIEFWATKISAMVIIVIGLYLLYKKIPKKPKIKSFSLAGPTPPMVMQQEHTGGASCSCGACKTDSTDLGVIVSAGIVPCPGTITIFIFTMSMGIYTIGFLSAAFMSIGMSIVIFVMALLSMGIRSKIEKGGGLVKILEYGSLVFILFLGTLLLII